MYASALSLDMKWKYNVMFRHVGIIVIVGYSERIIQFNTLCPHI